MFFLSLLPRLSYPPLELHVHVDCRPVIYHANDLIPVARHLDASLVNRVYIVCTEAGSLTTTKYVALRDRQLYVNSAFQDLWRGFLEGREAPRALRGRLSYLSYLDLGPLSVVPCPLSPVLSSSTELCFTDPPLANASFLVQSLRDRDYPRWRAARLRLQGPFPVMPM